MVTTNIRKTRSNDGAKIVASIKTEIYRDGCQTSLLQLRIVINRQKGVVTISYWNGLCEVKPSIVSVIQLEDLLAEELVYKHVSYLVDQVSLDQIDSKKLIEALVNDSSW